MYKGLCRIDIEMVGLYDVLEGKCLKALLRGFYFDLRKYPVSRQNGIRRS